MRMRKSRDQILLKMKKIITILALSLLCISQINAETKRLNFNSLIKQQDNNGILTAHYSFTFNGYVINVNMTSTDGVAWNGTWTAVNGKIHLSGSFSFGVSNAVYYVVTSSFSFTDQSSEDWFYNSLTESGFTQAFLDYINNL